MAAFNSPELKFSRLNKELKRIHEQNAELEDKNMELSNSLKRKEEEHSELLATCSQQQRELRDLECKLQQADVEKEYLEAKVLQLQQTSNNFKNNEASWKARCSTAERNLIILQKQYALECQNVELLKQQLTESERKVQDSDDLRSSVEKSLSYAEQQNCDLKKQLADLESSMSELKKHSQDLKMQKQKLEEEYCTSDRTTSVANLQNEALILRLEKKLDILDGRISHNQLQLRKIRNMDSIFRDDAKISSQKIFEVQQKHDYLKQCYEKTSAELTHERLERQKEYDALYLQITKSHEEKQNYISRIAELEESLKRKAASERCEQNNAVQNEGGIALERQQPLTKMYAIQQMDNDKVPPHLRSSIIFGQ